MGRNLFADGRVVGIVDRYDNTITFMCSTQTYKIDGVTRTKNLISKIGTVKEVAIEYKEDYSKQDRRMIRRTIRTSWKQSESQYRFGDLREVQL